MSATDDEPTAERMNRIRAEELSARPGPSRLRLADIIDIDGGES